MATWVFIADMLLRVDAAGHLERIRLLVCSLRDIKKGTQMVILGFAHPSQQFIVELPAHGNSHNRVRK